MADWWRAQAAYHCDEFRFCGNQELWFSSTGSLVLSYFSPLQKVQHEIGQLVNNFFWHYGILIACSSKNECKNHPLYWLNMTDTSKAGRAEAHVAARRRISVFESRPPGATSREIFVKPWMPWPKYLKLRLEHLTLDLDDPFAIWTSQVFESRNLLPSFANSAEEQSFWTITTFFSALRKSRRSQDWTTKTL